MRVEGVVALEAAKTPLDPQSRGVRGHTRLSGPVLFVTDGHDRSDAAVGAAEALSRWSGRPLEVLMVNDGGIAREIVSAASKLEASIVVLGSAPRTRRFRLAVGGERAAHVLRAAGCPVLSVTPDLVCPSEAILVAIDFGAASVHAAKLAMMVLAECGRMTLLHVLPPTSLDQPRSTDARGEARAREALGRVRAEITPLLPAGGEIALRIETEEIVDTILRCAAEERATLVAVGTHGPWAMRHLLLGSTAVAVLHTSPVSVLASPRPRAPNGAAAGEPHSR
jgi:nucleotide-binding universal stress UspA family protein